MKIYFAPLEGITGFAYRNAHSSAFGGDVDKYFAPFISPNYTHHLKGKEREDVLPENNRGLFLVPQILTNHAEDFLWAAGELSQMGYKEINLNLGCPMPTVARRGRGAGQLADLDALDRFLEEVCSKMKGWRLTVKTRIGLDDAAHAQDLCTVYSRYPIGELIVHPRTRRDLYGGSPDLDVFQMFYENCPHALVYNGDIFSKADHERIQTRFPRCSAVMLGRGLISDPALAREIRGGGLLSPEELKAFHDAVFEAGRRSLPGPAPLLGRMKELWLYMGRNFPGEDRLIKQIRKARTPVEYQGAVRTLFTCGRFSPADKG